MQMFDRIKIAPERKKKCWDSILRNVLNRLTVGNRRQEKKGLVLFVLFVFIQITLDSECV